MAPPIAKKFKFLEFLNKPIDRGKKALDGKDLFGKNKTYRGYVVGVIGGIIGAYLQMILFNIPWMKSFYIPGIDYASHYIIILLGVLLGLGAISGDLIESFLKRRAGMDSGKSLVPWDQIDHVIGAYLFVIPITLYYLTWQLFLCSLIATFFLHIVINHIAFYLDIRKEKW
jgi:CDP-2,3-bis-(O-geranylgeranyl)-sn-glycerol synthase